MVLLASSSHHRGRLRPRITLRIAGVGELFSHPLNGAGLARRDCRSRCRGVLHLCRGCPRKAVALLLAALLSIVLWKPICWAADGVHIVLTTQLGFGQLGSPPTPNDDSFAAYDWSVGLAGGPNTFLLRDPTDEIALPLTKHKYPVASENGFGEPCAGRVDHLFGHYYRCTF